MLVSSSSFQLYMINRYYHSLSVDSTSMISMISNKYLIVCKQVMVICGI